MAREDLADLIRANSANLTRRIGELHGKSHGQFLKVQNDLTDVKADLKEVRSSLD